MIFKGPIQKLGGGHPGGNSVPRTLPKLCGSDVELANLILGLETLNGQSTGHEASQALLREIRGVPRRGFYASRCSCPSGSACTCGFNPQDVGRRFLLSNGGAAYIDLNHLELCTPEVLSAYDHVVASRSMLVIAQQALAAANARLPPGQRLLAFANNSDGEGHAFGSHLNWLCTRRCYLNLFERRLQYLLSLATYFASSIIFTGAGKVGSENRMPRVDYQISQRADFFERLVGKETTYNRPIVNSRDESLGVDDDMARLHVIFFDNTLCHGSSLLKVGVTQIILAMIEQEILPSPILLDDPVEAVGCWSHDPSLRTSMPTVGGRDCTALEVQRTFLESAREFVASGRAEGIVPRAEEILALWADTLDKLESDVDALAPRIDWVLKKTLIEKAMMRHGLEWRDPQVKYLDHAYSSLDPDEGLYWACEKEGGVEMLVSDAEVERFLHWPPEDTRAWTRAQLMRRWGNGRIEDVDWDLIRFRVSHGRWEERRTLRMENPLGYTKAATSHIFSRTLSLTDTLDLLEALETRPPENTVEVAPAIQGVGAVKCEAKDHSNPERRFDS